MKKSNTKPTITIVKANNSQTCMAVGTCHCN